MQVLRMVQNVYGLISKVERRITLELDVYTDSLDKANVLAKPTFFLCLYN